MPPAVETLRRTGCGGDSLQRRRHRRRLLVSTVGLVAAAATFSATSTTAFCPVVPISQRTTTLPLSHQRHPCSSSSTALSVWWFGGTPGEAEVTLSTNKGENGDSCELVAVRIERTSANSRRIGGEITVEAPLEHVWAILTDYNRLSIHVPNLIESKIVLNDMSGSGGKPGDGNYQCRLYQKGAQKIVGFDFSASVTMDMTESVLPSNKTKRIAFKCVDSAFFTTFDGEWVVTEQPNPQSGELETTVSYTVDVRPKGPVPVAALEWRIREDVPTNLRAVKKAALKRLAPKLPLGASWTTSNKPQLVATLSKSSNDWDRDETMAKYL